MLSSFFKFTSKSRFTPSFITRKISKSSNRLHGEYERKSPKTPDEIVKVNFIDRNGTLKTVIGKIGDNVLFLARNHGIEIEGACEAALACSTCHVYVDHAFIDKLPQPKEEEEDMLDMAVFLKDNSRLCCQIILSKDIDGIRLTLPQATRNFYVDGHTPKPH